jgi:hypothetical protein
VLEPLLTQPGTARPPRHANGGQVPKTSSRLIEAILDCPARHAVFDISGKLVLFHCGNRRRGGIVEQGNTGVVPQIGHT